MLYKDTANQHLFATAVDSSDGSPALDVDFYITLDDGPQALISGTPVDKGNGQWLIPLSKAETDADIIGLCWGDNDVVPGGLTIQTTEWKVDDFYDHLRTLETRLSEARAGYLDNLNVVGTLANTDNADSFKADTSGLSTHTAADVKTALEAAGSKISLIQAETDKIDTLTEDSAGLRFTGKALEEAPTGGGDSVWNSTQRDQVLTDAAGAKTAAESADNKLEELERGSPDITEAANVGTNIIKVTDSFGVIPGDFLIFGRPGQGPQTTAVVKSVDINDPTIITIEPALDIDILVDDWVTIMPAKLVARSHAENMRGTDGANTIAPDNTNITNAKVAAESADGKLPADTTTKIDRLDANVSSRSSHSANDAKADVSGLAEKTDLPTNFNQLGINITGDILKVIENTDTPDISGLAEKSDITALNDFDPAAETVQANIKQVNDVAVTDIDDFKADAVTVDEQAIADAVKTTMEATGSKLDYVHIKQRISASIAAGNVVAVAGGYEVYDVDNNATRIATVAVSDTGTIRGVTLD